MAQNGPHKKIDGEAAKEATIAWTKCQFFNAERLIRAYGKAVDPAAIADQVFAECYEFEDMVKRAALGSQVNTDEGKILFSNYKMEIHSLLTKSVAKMLTQ